MRLLLVFISCGLFSCVGKSQSGRMDVVSLDTATAIVKHLHKRRGISYKQSKFDCLEARKELKARLDVATHDSLRKRIVDEARGTLTQTLIEGIIPWWYGTPWTFVGHTNDPNAGEVACGYFVSTTLQHAGLNINRYKLAQQNPLNEALSLAITGDPIILNNNGPETVPQYFREMKLQDGLYFVGLEFHVGYLYYENNNLFFIHSNYINAEGVIAEVASNSIAFSSSAQYYISPITTNERLVEKWVRNEEIAVRTN